MNDSHLIRRVGDKTTHCEILRATLGRTFERPKQSEFSNTIALARTRTGSIGCPQPEVSTEAN